MQPYAASGGALDTDGLLYLSGHDKPEFNVLAASNGTQADLCGDHPMGIEGQAIVLDDSAERMVIGISRYSRETRTLKIPPVSVPSGFPRLIEVNFVLKTPDDLSHLTPANLT